MPHRQHHRGAHPDDPRLFGAASLPKLRAAAEEVVWLLGRGYPMVAAVRAVGDHHQLELRQRLALSRSLCSTAQRDERARRRLRPEAVRGRRLAIDGFNLIITLEVALSRGLLLDGYDGALRDLAGLRGSYHPVAETEPALGLVGAALGALSPSEARFLLDEPVSNSGRLRARILSAASAWPVRAEVELVPDPDRLLAAEGAVASSDAAVIDACGGWLALSSMIVSERVPDAWHLRLIPD
jgi:hypothetical protein